MIKAGKTVTIYNPKRRETSKGTSFWTFSIKDGFLDKATSSFVNIEFNKGFINCLVFNNDLTLEDRQKVKIKSISSFEINAFGGREIPSLVLELEGSEDFEFEQEVQDTISIDADATELPF